MPKVSKEKRAKINEAINLCQTELRKFFEYLEENINDDKKVKELITLISSESYFAGGVFRSVFTDTEVQDLDIFFRSEEAVVVFKDFFLMNKDIFPSEMISANGTFSFQTSKSSPKLSFNTKTTGQPKDVVNEFDFTFNRHYYCVQNGECGFDVDTFEKNGTLLKWEHQPINTLLRFLRFLEEGFQMPYVQVASLINHMNTHNIVITDETVVKDVTYGSSGSQLYGALSLLKVERANNLQQMLITDTDLYGASMDNVEDNVSTEEPSEYYDGLNTHAQRLAQSIADIGQGVTRRRTQRIRGSTPTPATSHVTGDWFEDLS